MPKKSPVPLPTLPSMEHLALVEANPSRQEHVDLRELVLPAGNPREPVQPDQVRGLAATMERFGLLQPVVVMPCPPPRKGGYLLLAGHRRVAAARLLGWKTIAARVVMPASGTGDSIEHLSRAVALIENGQREDLDPLRDAEVVEHLLREDGATLESVAAELGRSRTWVARRARLSSLQPAVRKSARQGDLVTWPASWLELVALLPADDQVALVELFEAGDVAITSAAALEAAVRERLQRLGSAPWKLDDAALDPKAGACTACQKHTGAQKDLFEEPRGAALEDARCLDGACWVRKLTTWKAAAIAKAKAQHGDKLVLVNGREPALRRLTRDEEDGERLARDLEYAHEDAAPKKKGEPAPVRALESYQVQKAKKDEKGAVPALTVNGADAGKVSWVKVGNSGGASSARAKPAGPKPLAEKREQLQARRRRHVVEAAGKLLDTWADGELPKPLELLLGLPELLLGLVSIYGCNQPDEVAGGRERLRALGLTKKRNGRVLQGLLERWSELVATGSSSQLSPDQAYREVEVLFEAAGMLHLLDELRLDALAAHQEPKAWAAAGAALVPAAVVKPTPAPKAKKPSKKKPAAKGAA